MPAEDTVKPAPRLTLKSQLDDLALLWPWVEALAAEYAIPADTRFAIHLCLEEALSNIIRHGYRGQPNHTITVDCASPEANAWLVFTVEDQAPPFDPLAPSPLRKRPFPRRSMSFGPEAGASGCCASSPVRLAYQRLAGGNRLTIGFVLPR